MIKHEVRTCNKCGVMQTIPVKKPNHILHAVMTVVTLGFWLPVWMLAGIESLFKTTSAKCFGCGAKIR